MAVAAAARSAFAGSIYLCEVYWEAKDPKVPMIDRDGLDRAPQIEACKSLHEPT